MLLGIDPGWSTCGVSLTNLEGIHDSHEFIVPKFHGLNKAVDLIVETFKVPTLVSKVYIERFIPYNGIDTNLSEPINIFIGALTYYFQSVGIEVVMVRAADWKPRVCKYLVRKQGFDNPGKGFDKVFSLAAAKALSGCTDINDHEADAICLSYLGLMD